MLFGKEQKVFYLREGPLENLWGGEGGGAGEVQEKYSRKGKLIEKITAVVR